MKRQWVRKPYNNKSVAFKEKKNREKTKDFLQYTWQHFTTIIQQQTPNFTRNITVGLWQHLKPW